MCLIGFAWQVSAEYPFALIANRDEFRQRPSAPLHWWQDHEVAAGRDLIAQGTWLGVHRNGRFAAITNFRQPSSQKFATSRGQLVSHVLTSNSSLIELNTQLIQLGKKTDGFNLLYGDLFGEHRELRFISNRDEFSDTLAPGVYAFSNGPFNSAWPKSVNTQTQLKRALHKRQLQQFWDILQDQTQAPSEQLPNTGVGEEIEQYLSPNFIVGGTFGTRSSYRILLKNNLELHLAERRFSEDGQLNGVSNIIFRQESV